MIRSLNTCALALTLIAPTALGSTDELLQAVMIEQQAFEDGECDKLLTILDEDVTFYANGQRWSHAQVGKFCRNIKRPFGAGRAPIEDTVTPYLVTPEHGYTVRNFLWEDAQDNKMREVVTKVWRKQDGEWNILHFQSTVVPERPRKP